MSESSRPEETPCAGIPFNLNWEVEIRLTERGREILREKAQQCFNPPEWRQDQTRWQLWDLFATFGQHIYMGCRPPFETAIRLLPESAGVASPAGSSPLLKEEAEAIARAWHGLLVYYAADTPYMKGYFAGMNRCIWNLAEHYEFEHPAGNDDAAPLSVSTDEFRAKRTESADCRPLGMMGSKGVVHWCEVHSKKWPCIATEEHQRKFPWAHGVAQATAQAPLSTAPVAGQEASDTPAAHPKTGNLACDESLTALLGALDAAYEKMTPGPWHTDGSHIGTLNHGRLVEEEDEVTDGTGNGLHEPEDAEGIVALVNAWPTIREMLRRLE